MFSSGSLRPNRTVVRKWKLKKNTKQKSKNKDNDSNVQSQRTGKAKRNSDEDGDSETVIGMAPPKNKNIAFCDGLAKSSASDNKWI